MRSIQNVWATAILCSANAVAVDLAVGASPLQREWWGDESIVG